MKKIITRLVVLFAIVALVFGTLPANSAEAASKKSKKKTIVVTTQEELVAALKKYGSSNSKVKIKIETTETSTFTLSAKYSSDSIQIVVDAPNATIKSKAKVSSITINEAKSVKEYASGNKITVNDEKMTFTAMENASVEKLTIASETGTVKVVNNGGIEKVSVKTEVKVDLTQNGEMGRVYVAAAADISVSGTSEESLKVTVQKDAVGASVKSEVPVSVNAYADVDLTLEKGAENSKVTMKDETAGVKLENNTEETVSVKDTEGKTQKVETGEDLTTDNFVGKPDEPETTDGTVTEQPKEEEQKEEEKKEEEKEEEKKDDTTSTGGSDPGTSGGDYYPVLTPQEQLQNKLTVASYGTKDEDREAWLTQDLTLTTELTIPSGVCLVLDGHTLNAGSLITLQPDASIWVTPGSNLVVDNDPFKYAPDDDGFTHAELTLEVNGVIKIGDYSIIGMGSEFDPIATRIIIENRLKDEKVPQNPDEEVSASNPEIPLKYTERNVRFDYMGKSFDIFTESGSRDDFAKVFGGNRAYWVDQSINPDRPQNDDILTSLEINPLSNVLYDSREVTFNGQPIYSTTVGIEDWINAYLDPGMNWSAFTAVEQGKTVPSGITVPQTKDDPMVVTVTDNTIHFKKNVYVREEATLIAHNIVYDQTQPVAGPVGGDFQNAPGIRVSGNLVIDSITSAGFYGDNQELIKMQGANSTLKKGTRSYKINTDDEWLKTDPYVTAYSYCCWNADKQYYGYMFYTWEFEKGFELQASENDTEYYKVVGSPVDSEPVRPGTPITAKDADQVRSVADSTSRWTDWGFADELSLNNYPNAISEKLDFTAATIQSNAESATDGCSDKKLIDITPIEARDENNQIIKDDNDNICYQPVDFCGMKITVANDTMLQLNPDVEMFVQRGGELVIDGVTVDKSTGKNIYLSSEGEEEAIRSGRIVAKWGGKITIGDYSFQTQNHGDFDDDFGVYISVGDEEDRKTGGRIKFVKLEIPEDVIIKHKDGSAITADEIDSSFNSWLKTNRIKIEIINKSLRNSHGSGNGEPDYFPSIKFDDSYYFTHFTSGTLIKGEYTLDRTDVEDGNTLYYFSTDSEAGLMAIWSEIEKPRIGKEDEVDRKWSYIKLTENVELEHMTMDLPATFVLENNVTLTLWNNANITASVNVASGSAVRIGMNSSLSTTEFRDCLISGSLELQDNAVFRSQWGSALKLESGAQFVFAQPCESKFECGCVRFPDENNPGTYSYILWFENDGGTVSGDTGVAELYVEYKPDTPVFTESETEALVNELKGKINNDSIGVEMYVEPQS